MIGLFSVRHLWRSPASDERPVRTISYARADTTLFLAGTITPDIKTALERWYGKDKATEVKYAEAFEICEYGAQPDDEEVKRLFPMLGK